MMDRVEDRTVAEAERVVRDVPSVDSDDRLRTRWVGQHLLAKANMSARRVAHAATGERHRRRRTHRAHREVHRLADATVQSAR